MHMLFHVHVLFIITTLPCCVYICMHTHTHTHTHTHACTHARTRTRTCTRTRTHTHTHTHTGNLPVQLRRYLKDTRTIPVVGDSSGQTGIRTQSTFSITDNILYLSDPQNGPDSIPLGSHVQYIVGTPSKE